MLLAAVTQTADEAFRIHDILRAVSGALEVPVIVLLGFSYGLIRYKKLR